MRGDDDTRRDPAAGLPDAALWRRSRSVELTEDVTEAEGYLDLAGFADGRLDPDDRERVAERLAGDPVAAGDVAAARAFAADAEQIEAMPEPALVRAYALVDGGDTRGATVIPFAPSRPNRPRLQGVARWGSLVAAMAVASWLGFTLGVDTSRSYAQIRQTGADGLLPQVLDPSAGFLRHLTAGSQTG